jgi:hypothetical protein
LKKDVVWNAAPCGVVEIYGRFGGTYCIRRQASCEIQAERAVKTPHAFTGTATRTSRSTQDA